ncbi:hypothetical protein MTR_7g067040 [Medicago truncatula]|uniref:Uncharacterized protein n=1 Tax=Medicago truncatula TaxID=3880 RepID=A0A072U112_MEDTR|nr:hypothetical protein MTR_7g067040 [Medicago truncatula]
MDLFEVPGKGRVKFNGDEIMTSVSGHASYCYIAREKLQANILKLLPVSSKDQVVDFFTKALLPQSFSNLLSKLGMIYIYQSPTCGRILHHEKT